MAKNNSNLHGAKKAKNDEFYTQLSDIEKECVHYRPHFKGKVVFCNCNDALHSNFAKYFSLNFEFLGLKKLICTAYKVDGVHGKVCIYEGDKNGNRVPDLDEWECHMLDGDGGFASEECIEFLKEADIVVTNPPFSLFREYVALLMQYNKKFLIIGNMNAITYKEIFPLIKNNQLWAGFKPFGGGMDMIQTEDTFDETKTKSYKINDKGEIIKNIMGCIWFTNLTHSKRTEPIDLYKHYNEEEYPKYDNYDAIEVGKVSDIPMDYDGVIGVPITFLGQYCPSQFEIIWTTDRGGDGMIEWMKKTPFDKSWDSAWVNGQKVYKRIFIKRVSK